MPAYTEGRLEAWQNTTLFLGAEGVLLVEFAIVLEKWRLSISQGKTTDLYYASMDFEEEPIFGLDFDSSTKLFTPISV